MLVTRPERWPSVCCVEDSSEAATEVTWPLDMVSRGVVALAVAPEAAEGTQNQSAHWALLAGNMSSLRTSHLP